MAEKPPCNWRPLYLGYILQHHDGFVLTVSMQGVEAPKEVCTIANLGAGLQEPIVSIGSH